MVLLIGHEAKPSFVIFSYLIFIENHWFFTAHYVRVAVLFRGLFSSESSSDIQYLQHRHHKFRALTAVVAIFLAIVQLMSYWEDVELIETLLEWFYVFYLWALAILNLGAMWYIL